ELSAAAPYKMHQRCAERFHVGRVVLAGDAAHVTNPTGGFGLTGGLFDAFALWPTLAAVLLDGADPALLERWADDRRAIYLERTSPQAIAYKRLVFHANGGGAELEAGLEGLRAMVRDPDVRLQRLMFTKSLETPSPAELQSAK
ncbi:MAG: FAD-dependent monooxygenase, partial [Porphyrobacter sp.]|nr:FAD-dependent monooxygenase [Porphyrobacter sp.]